MRIAVLDDYLNLSQRLADWSAVRARAEVVVFDRHLSEAEAPAALAGFDVLCHMRERMPMSRALIEQLPRLKHLVITGPSHRTLDMGAVADRGVTVDYVLSGGVGQHGTPELAWGLILGLARQIPQAAAAMKSGGWQRHTGHVLHGRTLGLIGLGRIGRAMVPIAQAFGMRVLAWSSNLQPEAAAAAGVQWAGKDELLSESDYLSLHLVMSERSRHTLAARDFALMKPGACLVNTARAGLVDTEAMLRALSEGRLAGAALDVFDVEPLPDRHPLRGMDNVILTPHLGYSVEESMAQFHQSTVQALLAWLDGAAAARA